MYVYLFIHVLRMALFQILCVSEFLQICNLNSRYVQTDRRCIYFYSVHHSYLKRCSYLFTFFGFSTQTIKKLTTNFADSHFIFSQVFLPYVTEAIGCVHLGNFDIVHGQLPQILIWRCFPIEGIQVHSTGQSRLN